MPVFQAIFCAILHILHSLRNLEPPCTPWFHLYIFIPFCFLQANIFSLLFLLNIFLFSSFKLNSPDIGVHTTIPHAWFVGLVWGSSFKCGCYLVGFILSNMMLLCRRPSFWCLTNLNRISLFMTTPLNNIWALLLFTFRLHF